VGLTQSGSGNEDGDCHRGEAGASQGISPQGVVLCGKPEADWRELIEQEIGERLEGKGLRIKGKGERKFVKHRTLGRSVFLFPACETVP
jgi:2'-5' RNA ligase